MVLPFLHALNRVSRQSVAAEEPDAYLNIYHHCRKLQDNEVTREMVRQLLEPAWARVITTARRQQGLIYWQRLLAGASAANQ